MAVYTTTPFRLTPSVYFRIAAGRSMPRVALLLAIPFIILIAVGVLHDVRFLFIALMVPFIFAPIIISHIFYSTLLHPDARRSLRHQQAILMPGKSIELQFLEVKTSESDHNNPPADKESPSVEKRNDDTEKEPEFTISDSSVFKWPDTQNIFISSRCLVFGVTGSKLPIAIPLDTLPNDFGPYEFIAS